MKRFKLWGMIFFLSLGAQAETIQQYRDRENPFYGNTLETKRGGGSTVYVEQPSRAEFQSAEGLNALQEKIYKSQISVRLTCRAADSLMGFPVRYRAVHWKIQGSTADLEGRVLSEGNGFVNIVTHTRSQLQGAKVVLTLKNHSVNMVLGESDYELELPEAACR